MINKKTEIKHAIQLLIATAYQYLAETQDMDEEELPEENRVEIQKAIDLLNSLNK